MTDIETPRDTDSPPAPTPAVPQVNELTEPVALDDATCFKTPDGGVLIEPLATPIRWLSFILLTVLAMLTLVLFVVSLTSLDASIPGVFGWLLRNTVLVLVIIGLALVLYPQWLALRRPVVTIVPNDEIVEIIRANSIRRIPFPVITSLRIAADPVENPLDRVLNVIFERLNVQRRGVGLVLKHGEVVWCGVLSGEDARERARLIRQRISQSIAGNR